MFHFLDNLSEEGNPNNHPEGIGEEFYRKSQLIEMITGVRF
jgi:hypothetical protein